MAWLPHETARYTTLGGVVLGTACVAAFSMFFALDEVLGGFSLWMLVPVVGWGLLVLNLDRWLIASTTGSRWHKRLAMLLPRLVLAVMFGVVIAEPVVLRIFETAIEKHVEDGRTQQLATLRDQLVRCNPVPEQAGPTADPASPDCRSHLLTVPGDPAALVDKLNRLNENARTLQQTIQADSATLTRLNEDAQKECSGASGPGFTGKAGYGRQCLDRRADAEQFARTHPIEAWQQQLTQVRGEITTTQQQLGPAEEVYAAAVKQAIENRVAEERSHQGPIGLLERFRALDELVASSGFLTGVRWAIRVFFVVVDSLPVLTKLMSATTGYDKLTDRLSSTRDRVFATALRAEETTESYGWEKVRQEAETQMYRDQDVRDLDQLRHQTELNQTLEDKINQLTERYRRQINGGRPVDAPLNGHSR